MIKKLADADGASILKSSDPVMMIMRLNIAMFMLSGISSGWRAPTNTEYYLDGDIFILSYYWVFKDNYSIRVDFRCDPIRSKLLDSVISIAINGRISNAEVYMGEATQIFGGSSKEKDKI